MGNYAFPTDLSGDAQAIFYSLNFKMHTRHKNFGLATFPINKRIFFKKEKYGSCEIGPEHSNWGNISGGQ